jgi:cytoskeletal protein CcmA (bactofilin family)
MIRMGRNSRTDDTNNTTSYQGGMSTSEPGYHYNTEPAAGASRVVSDSESIARDIKEGRLSGFVGHGTTLTGETNFQMMLRVDGHLTGTVSSDGGTLLVGTQGQVDANISVATAMVNGTVNGDILATEKIQLGRTAKVIGNIQAPRLVLEDGALLEGGCTMIKARETVEKNQAAAATQSTSNTYSSYSATESASDTDDADEYLTSSEDEEDEETAEAATI